ncbi:MAG: sigma 54-interacting transcriptional regulator, partial [Planctomycetota bacterium]|nr:sigma 54-interacting transcriptional regulator [Planctomycetota bacterium]
MSLENVRPYAIKFTQVIAAVTGIDVEIVDIDLIRVAGTGIYAEHVGKSLTTAGNLYRKAMRQRGVLFIDNPRDNPLCCDCPDRGDCREKLTIGTPIAVGNEVQGVIGLVCFNDADRERVLANREMYSYFIEILADILGRTALIAQNARENLHRLDALLKITDQSGKSVLALDRGGGISLINDRARQELGLEEDISGREISIIPTGDAYSGLDEFDVVIRSNPADPDGGERRLTVLGRLTKTEENDPLFSRALAFESKPSLAAMLSSMEKAASNTAALDAIIGESETIQELKARARQIAAAPSTVLISGESGVGKEMFARAIHAASPRSNRPFIAINCGAIPDALLESELFGYVKGAFTDANPTGRMGKFELADGGILFLDEIGSLPIHLQVKLLRVIQERNFTRLGSNKPISVNIRIIAASNELLPDMIAEKRFREDLFYRLNVIPMEIPPLRCHKEDIPALAEYFLDRYCRLFGKPPLRLSPSLLANLMPYDWPGNIREFENCIEYMVNMHQGGEFTAATLPPQLSRPPPAAARRAVIESTRRRRIDDPKADEETVLPLADLER